MKETNERHYSTRDIAEILTVGIDKVCGWIKSGELIALDISNSKSKPRYRISREAFLDFQRRRSTEPQSDAVESRTRRNKKPIRKFV